MPVATPSVPRSAASTSERSLLRRLLTVLALASITVAVVGLLQGWPNVWVPCAIAGVLMLLDVRLLVLARRGSTAPSSALRRRVVVAIVVALGLIGVAIAVSVFGDSGWRMVGIASLVAFGLMILITMPVLAAASHDAAASSERARRSRSTT